MSGRVEFVSYDGKYPNLCAGTLVLNIDGADVSFAPHALSPGGSVRFDKEWNEEVSKGPWTVSEWPVGFPEELREGATDVVNANVPHGCCGGCV